MDPHQSEPMLRIFAPKSDPDKPLPRYPCECCCVRTTRPKTATTRRQACQQRSVPAPLSTSPAVRISKPSKSETYNLTDHPSDLHILPVIRPPEWGTSHRIF